MDLTLDQEIWFKVTEHPLPITTNVLRFIQNGATNITRGDINPLYSIIS